ncbi:hypothetical protein, partial [Escherichia coli]|uniref:hypothetical protein n=1 Tax=Escherichia coli TaxID=562 RepID=UPI001BC86441
LQTPAPCSGLFPDTLRHRHEQTRRPAFCFLHPERTESQVSAALNGIVKIIKAQNFSVFFVKKIIRMKFHNIAGKFASLWCGFSFTGFS